MNTIRKLEHFGQSIWLDNISRGLIRRGELQKMVDEGLSGVTSNPTIFEKAISGSDDYDNQIHELLESRPRIDTAELVRELIVTDIQMACDLLSHTYKRTQGRDGYVSVEVSPGKAHDTQATITEVHDLWKRITRKNLMVKIPATKEGVPAIEQCVYDGININVTLIFSVERYRDVANAYITGLERRVNDNKSINHVWSVASVFVSRIDTLIDGLLEQQILAVTDNAGVGKLRGLRGQAAIANAKMAYQAFKEFFSSQRFKALEKCGANVQRPLWGSTGRKNPTYGELLYVDTLIGPFTVNTVPPQTYAAILEHCRPVPTIESGLDAARASLRSLAAVGIDLEAVMKKLEDDGVGAFEKSFDRLYEIVLEKRKTFAMSEA